MKNLVLIGGGNTKEHENKKIHQYIIESSGKKDPRILYFPTASYNSQNNINNFINCLEEFTPNIDIALSDDFRIREKMRKADIIYIGGGNTSYLIDEFQSKGIIKALMSFMDEKIIVGISAGAIFWFEYFFSDCDTFESGNGIWNYKIKKGIGLFNAYCSPHYDEPERITFNDYVGDKLALALENNTAIAVSDNNIDIIKEDGEKAVYYFYDGMMRVLTERNKTELLYLLKESQTKGK